MNADQGLNATESVLTSGRHSAIVHQVSPRWKAPDLFIIGISETFAETDGSGLGSEQSSEALQSLSKSR